MVEVNWSEVIPFNRLSTLRVPANSGLYVFVGDKGTNGYPAVYIGESGNLQNRFQQYLNGENQCVTDNAKNFMYSLELNHFVRKQKEEELIKQYNPTCNIEYNR